MTEDTGRPENARFLRLAWKIGAVGLFIFIVGCFFVDPLSWDWAYCWARYVRWFDMG